MKTGRWVPLSFSSPCSPAQACTHLVLEGIRNGKNLWENYEITAVSFMSNLALPKCMEFLYTGFLQRNLCPVCMPVIDFVKFGRTFHSGSTCVYKGSTVFKVWLFESQSYPVPGKEITKYCPCLLQVIISTDLLTQQFYCLFVPCCESTRLWQSRFFF